MSKINIYVNSKNRKSDETPSNFSVIIPDGLLKSKSRRWPAARAIATHTTQGRARFITRPPRCRRVTDPVLVRRVARQWGGVGSAPVCVCVWALWAGQVLRCWATGPPSGVRGSRDLITCRSVP